MDTKEGSPQSQLEKPRKKVKAWVYACLILAGISLLYRLLVFHELEQTSLMFIGLPLFLAIGLAFTPDPKSATGMIMKGITMLMLVFGILLIEGFICILIASPLFYGVGLIVGLLCDYMGSEEKRNNKVNSSVFMVLFFFSLEGVSDLTSFHRDEVVVIEAEYTISASDALLMLEKGPSFNLEELPVFLKLGFPLPQGIEGKGIALRDRWEIHFAGGEGKPGDLIVEVIEAEKDRIVFKCIDDTSHIAHWMNWKTIEWKLTECGENRCKIQMKMEYERLLDPAWYFKPVERYGVEKAGEFFMSQIFRAKQ